MCITITVRHSDKKIDICHPHIYTNKTYVKCASILLDLRGLIDIGMFIRYHQSHPSDRCKFDGFLKNKMVIAAPKIEYRRQPQPRGYIAIGLSLRVRIGTIYSL